MKNKIIGSIVLLLLLYCPSISGQSSYKLETGQVTIKGTSSLHDWESTVTQLTVSGDFIMDVTQLETIQNLKVAIPVKEIKSTKGSIMDKKTWKALEYSDHPMIKYVLNKITAIDKQGENYRINATGNLSIAGSTKPINLTVTVSPKSNRKLEIRGEKALKMTDFNIEPPTALLGTLTTGDDITIEFNIVLTKTEQTSLTN